MPSVCVPMLEIGAEECFGEEMERVLAKTWRIWNVI